jgi:hypothetical protein
MYLIVHNTGTLTDYATMLTIILTLLSYSHSCYSNERITYSMSVYRLYIFNVHKVCVLSNGVFYISYCINRRWSIGLIVENECVLWERSEFCM